MLRTAEQTDDVFHTVLIFRILQGNINGFEILLEKYHRHVIHVVSRHVPLDKAPEVAQEAFVRAYKSLKLFKGTKPFKHWLSKIALACCFDFLRKSYRRKETPVSALSEPVKKNMERLLSIQSAEEFKKQAMRRETGELLDWALGKLEPDDRMALTLTYFDGYSIAEAAEFLEWSASNVKVRMHRARHLLRDILSKLIFENEL